ncbi:MAG: Anthranilate phosphoribosyltransferase [Parcubacteria group bacterium GW2011_GWC2_44_22]|nr:MAG: Anthranilate phosphoribosyltransferase [Parcubacteria group bacterium GW2011_GWC2_44_22]
MRQMMSGQLPEIQIAAILTAMAAKGETISELTGMAKVMREFSVKVPIKNPLLDTCGTGGSGLARINVSTASAFVLAACGVRVAKHGNRAASGRVGSFDLLETLGAKIDLTPQQVAKTIKLTGLGFMFAPLHHPAMKHVGNVRRQLGIKTVFNILGPLTNPASASYHVLGISDPNQGPKIIQVMRALGNKRVLVVAGEDGLDEITLSGQTLVWELTAAGKIKTYKIKPADFGLNTVPFDKIKGRDKEYNAKIIRDVFSGLETGPYRDLIALNAAAGLYIYGKAKSIKEGLRLAKLAIKNGTAQTKLETYVKLSNN